jgi:hypothetical protein
MSELGPKAVSLDAIKSSPDYLCKQRVARRSGMVVMCAEAVVWATIISNQRVFLQRSATGRVSNAARR